MAPAYRGRFAPSPTGLLHRGSLFAAVASFIDARAAGGTWLVRMEDLDAPRAVPGADQAILDTLARFGMCSDEPVLRQSTRLAAYAAALEQLAARGLAYRCRCTRSEIGGPYRGRCRDLGLTDPDTAWRLRLPDAPGALDFTDRLQGAIRVDAQALGDPVIRRRDGIPAYLLAVVVDDAFQGITDVVRGADLLEGTGWQVALCRALGLPPPRYLHVPVLTEPDGTKLAKSRRSVAVNGLEPGFQLEEILQLSGLQPPIDLKAAPVSEMLAWAARSGIPAALAGRLRIALPD